MPLNSIVIVGFSPILNVDVQIFCNIWWTVHILWNIRAYYSVLCSSITAYIPLYTTI